MRQLPQGLKLSANPNHVTQLSASQLADLTKRTGVRNIQSRSGHFEGVVDTEKGAFTAWTPKRTTGSATRPPA